MHVCTLCLSVIDRLLLDYLLFFVHHNRYLQSRSSLHNASPQHMAQANQGDLLDCWSTVRDAWHLALAHK